MLILGCNVPLLLIAVYCSIYNRLELASSIKYADIVRPNHKTSMKEYWKT